MKKMRYRKRQLPDTETFMAEVRRIYRYDDVNGGLIWQAFRRPDNPGQAKLGASVGGDDGHGYLMCMVLGHKFKVHQIVWALHNGRLSDMPLDHIDRDPRNNRIENLRQATDEQNSQNLRASLHPNAGLRFEPNGKVSAYASRKNRKIYLGRFDTEAEARAAYRAASKVLKGAFSPV